MSTPDADYLAYLDAHAQAVTLDDGRTIDVTGSIRRAIDGARGPGPLRVEIAGDFHDGGGYVLEEGLADDLGDFHGAGFIQRCLRLRMPGCPLTVYFRPDRDSERCEVVFENFRLLGRDEAKSAKHLGPYAAEIYRGDTLLATIAVPSHPWGSRWRWQSSPRPTVFAPINLMADLGIIPAEFDKELLPYTKKPPAGEYSGPMSSAGLKQHMPDTADRPEIGWITEWNAHFLATWSTPSLMTSLAHGEACGSIPWHIRDDGAGCPVNLYSHPLLSWSETPPSNPALPWCKVYSVAGGWTVDVGHHPSLAYVPYLLTGDPYFLEELQFTANHNLGLGQVARRRDTQLLLMNDGMPRSFAWSLRSVSQAWKATPEEVPSWLLPRSYWSDVLSDNADYFTDRYVNGESPTFSVLHAFWAPPEDGGKADYYWPAWQQSFIGFSIAAAVRMGRSEWRPALEWIIKSTIARTGAEPSWNKQVPAPYLVELFEPAEGAPPPAYGTTRKLNPSKPLDCWPALWAATAGDPNNGVLPTPPPNNLPGSRYYPGYEQYPRAELAVSGMAEAAEGEKHLRSMILAGTKLGRSVSCRWAFAPVTRATPTTPEAK